MKKEEEFEDYGAIYEMFENAMTAEGEDPDKRLYDLCKEIWEHEYCWKPSYLLINEKQQIIGLDWFEEVVKPKLNEEMKDDWDGGYWFALTNGLAAVIFGVGFVAGMKYKVTDPRALQEIEHLSKRVDACIAQFPYSPR